MFCLVDYGKVLYSANEPEQNSNASNVKRNLNSMNIHLTVFEVDSMCLHYLDFCDYSIIFCLSLVNNR